jgi:Transposase IS116/IS110/IS902 family
MFPLPDGVQLGVQLLASEDRLGRCPAPAGAVVDRGGCRSRGSHRRTSWISAPGSGPVICSLTSERSGSSGCTRCSTTRGSRNPQFALAREPRMDRGPDAPGRRRRAARDRAPDHRRARHPAGPVRLRAARDRAQTAGLPRADPEDLRRRRPDRGHHPRRARRRARFHNSRDVVRYGGLDITVYQSDDHRAPGHLSRQGPPALRWTLYEAAQRARLPASPDRPYYEQLAARIGGNRACLALARKLPERTYHILKELSDQALAPIS